MVSVDLFPLCRRRTPPRRLAWSGDDPGRTGVSRGRGPDVAAARRCPGYSIDAARAHRRMAVMVCELIALTFSSPDPERLAGFWGGLLGQDVAIERGAPSLTAPPEVG